MDDERAVARGMEANARKAAERDGAKPLDWRDQNLQAAMNAPQKKGKRIAKAAKETLSRLSNEEVREFAAKHAPPAARKKRK